MGKLFLNLISVRRNDESRDSRYSNDEFSSGWYVEAESEQRKMLSTTHDGSIFIDVDATGMPNVYTRFLPDNLEQAKLAALMTLRGILGRLES